MRNPPNVQVQAACLRSRRKFILLLFAAAVLLLCLQFLAGRNEDKDSDGLCRLLNNVDPQVEESRKITGLYNQILRYFDRMQMEGVWKQKGNYSNVDGPLGYPVGRVTLAFHWKTSNDSKNVDAVLMLYNGNYIDNGYTRIVLLLKPLPGNYTHTKGNYTFYSQQKFAANYSYAVKLKSLQRKELQIQSLNISFVQPEPDAKPIVSMSMSLIVNADHLLIDFENATEPQSTLHYCVLSLLLTLMLGVQLDGSVKIARKVRTGQDNVEKYSVATFLVMAEWDLTIVTLLMVGIVQKNKLFQIYLLPSFAAAYILMIVEIYIFAKIVESCLNGRGFYCMLLSRVSLNLLVIWAVPICIYFNLSPLFFILLPLLLLPQLYQNALIGRKLQIDPNFLKVFLPRFATILYIKGFSQNLFNIQPSRAICFAMLSTLGLMLGLLWFQTKCGSRSIFPKFLLPQVHNYFQDEGESCMCQFESDSLKECCICLTPLHNQPPDDIDPSLEYKGRIMTTPCKHKFHGSCLVQWFKRKMECPACRGKLPPYE